MIRFSTGLRDKINDFKGEVVGAVIGAGLAFAEGAGDDNDTITDSGDGFVTAGFSPGDKLFIQGTTLNDGASGAVLLAVAAGTIEVANGTLADESPAPAGGLVAVAKGGALRDIMKHGKLMIYSGAQPSDPDDAISAQLLLTITESGGTFAHGSFANGINFGASSSCIIDKDSNETWQGVCSTGGIAGWFLFVANPTDNLASSTTLARISGSVGGTSADLVIPNTTLVADRTYTIDEFKFELPMYYGA